MRRVASVSFFPGSILASAVVLAVASSAFPLETVLKGAYAPLGLSLGAVLYYGVNRTTDRAESESGGTRAAKGLVIVAALATAVSATTGSRVIFLLVAVPVCYALLFRQYQLGVRAAALMPQVVVVYALGPLTKVLATGLYFGAGDTFGHLRKISSVLATGHVADIGYPYASFPGLHVLSAAVSQTTGLPPYPTYVLLGITAFSFTVVTFYKLVRLFFDRQSAIAVLIALSVLAQLKYFAVYFFPQSLATVYAVFVLYLAYKYRYGERGVRLQLLAFLFAAVAIVTHHLTLYLFIPVIVLVLTVGTAVREWFDVRVTPWRGLFGIVGLATVFYWLLVAGSLVYYGFVLTPIRLLAGPALSGGAAENPRTEIVLGLVDTSPSVLDAEVIFMLILVLFFAVGVKSILDAPSEYIHASTILVLGVVAALFVLDTPVSIKSFSRIGLPFQFFFAVVLGVGIRNLATASRGSRASVVVLILVVGLGTAGAVTAADDAPHVQTIQDDRRAQTALSAAETSQLEAASAFTAERQLSPTSLWVTRSALRLFDTQASRPSLTTTTIHGEPGSVLYRDAWSDHIVRYSTQDDYLGKLYVSEAALDEWKTTNDKVYAAGEIGVVETRGQPLRSA